jgi:hypothetical protein
VSAVRYSFQVKRTGAGSPKRVVAGKAAPVPKNLPRVARLLALAHKFHGMLDRGEVESMAELARLGGVSRARITQVMDLLMLAPEIQEQVLFGRDVRGLRELMVVCRRGVWIEQRRLWNVRPAASNRR